MSSAARVRVLDSSLLRGQVLTVVDIKIKEQMGTTKVSYLCKMSGYRHPSGWFREDEVEVVD